MPKGKKPAKTRLTKEEYRKKYLDPRWQKKRLQVLERDEYCCQSCFADEFTLHVHHRYYIKGADPWDYPLEAFLTLCEDCHKDETEHRYEAEQQLLQALKEKFLTFEIQLLTNAFKSMPMLAVPEVVAGTYEWALTSKEVQRELFDRFFKYIEEENKKRKK